MDLADEMAAMLNDASTEAEFAIERGHIEHGRSFSREAMDVLERRIMLWVLTRAQRRWDATNEPPTAIRVTVNVEVR